MKKLITATAFCLLASNSAFAYFVQGAGENSWVDVGDLDSYFADGTLGNSGTNTEATWASEETGETLTFSTKTEDLSFSSELHSVWTLGEDGSYTQDQDLFAFDLRSDPDPSYFLVKNGNSSANDGESDSVLYKNEANTGWAVISFSALDSLIHLGSFAELTISHVTEFNGGTTIVSEPATYGLLALGLTGLIGARRRAKKLS